MLKRISQFIASVKPFLAPATAPEDVSEFVGVMTAIRTDARLNDGWAQITFGKNPSFQAARKAWPSNKKVRFAVWLMEEVQKSFWNVSAFGSRRRDDDFVYNTLDAWMGRQIIDTPASTVVLGRLFLDHKRDGNERVTRWPIKKYVRQLERRYGEGLVPEPEVAALIREYLKRVDHDRALKKRFTALLALTGDVRKFRFTEIADNFGAAMNILLDGHWPAGKVYPLLEHAYTAKTGTPSETWLKTASKLLAPLTDDKLNEFFEETLDLVLRTPAKVVKHRWHTDGLLLEADNQQIVKGLVWTMSLQNRETISRKLAKLAQVSYKKVPGKGPIATKLGNACVTALSLTDGLHGISQLAGLAYRIKQTGIRNKVNQLLENTATERGVSRQQIEDLSVLEFGLANDLILTEIGDYTARIQLVKPGKSILSWRIGEKQQKSIPKAVKDHFPSELKALKVTKKSLETDSLNLRDRIDWGLRLDRSMTMEYFAASWRTNSLLNYFAERMVWLFGVEEQKNGTAALWQEGKWVNATGATVDISSATIIRLWHPAIASADEVEAWRKYLIGREVAQPLKQAFREVYVLTAAEERTNTYSNRMAAHILKQHQFANLARGRGWAYSLIGAFDHGMLTQACYQELPELGIRAEYFIQEMNDEDNYNQTGMWNYVSTDQVRFLDLTRHHEVLELTVIPPVLFSEILRDTDLFVGVASIGNDDQWADSGGGVYRDYFHNYSTAALTETGGNRKLALERLLPRLKIRDVATVDDKFLRVTGKVRKYKIHIGSGNILMEPNDQYLCIVPSAYNRDDKKADQLYLPFDGDRTLSIIISKALLLAEDDKITDATITRQLRK